MTVYQAPRTCTEKIENISQSKSIAYFRDRPVYVLLAEPGAGKTTLFKLEAKDSGAEYLSARDFIALENQQWQDQTLFIDGLDEVRAGKDDPRTPLDAIRNKLSRLGCRRFRISCREADWLEGSDYKALQPVCWPEEPAVLYLDPLTDDDIRLILRNKSVDVQEFFAKAESFGLTGLLNNPQTLEMLITAVIGGQWPNTKQQIYDLASIQLATETNDEHLVAEKPPIASQKLIETAGLLCAIQLIANLSGYTLYSNGCAELGRVALTELNLPDTAIALKVLKTRLFTKNVETYSYVHRSVAEYLAAQYIAEKIKHGLPVSRVLALTTGVDGGIVAAMRGLMAWLCTLSPKARDILIETDPLGIVIYGDVKFFLKETKSRLLQTLIRNQQEISYRINDLRTNTFTAITTKDMADELVEIFKSADRTDGFLYLIYCLLTGLRHSEPIAEIKPALLAIIRDQTHSDYNRVDALRAFIHQYPEDMESLMVLAEDFRQDNVADTTYNMLETLLEKLFPARIKADKILLYLLNRKDLRVINAHEFWYKYFPSRIADNELPEILDELARRGPSFLEFTAYQTLFDVAGQLLSRGLAVHGLNISDERLYQWLSIDIDEYQYKIPEKQSRQIAAWLTAHPERCLALLGEGLKQIRESADFRSEIGLVFLRLHDAAIPDNLGLWWLDKALKAPDFELSKSYVEQAFCCLLRKQGDSGLSLEHFVAWIENHPQYQEYYQSLIFTPVGDWRIKHAISNKKWAQQRATELTDRLGFLNEHIAQIADGSAPPAIYHDLATMFDFSEEAFGKFREPDFSEFLNHDQTLIAAVKSGFRNILRRTDLPIVEEIFLLDATGRRHFIRLPFLVCLDMLYQENPAMPDSLSDDLVCKALAFGITERLYKQPWFILLCIKHQEMAAGIFKNYITRQIAAKSQNIQGLYELADNSNYQSIAKLIVMPILNQYPVRAYKQHVRNLELLLKTAIDLIDRHELLKLIETKLVHKSMDMAQRVYWLAAGLLIEPELFHERIKTALTGHTERINHFSDFWLPYFSKKHTKYPLPEQIIGWLIEIFAPRGGLTWKNEAGVLKKSFVNRSMEEGGYVRFLIDSLANNPSKESTAILADLQTKTELQVWRQQIQNALQIQKISHREAMFLHPDALQVIETLNNRKPANVADLAALTVDMLRELGRQTHTGNTDTYKQFWNCDSKEIPLNPRHEGLCRDFISEYLKPRLAQYHVNIEPESLQANEKRADLKLSFMRSGRTFYLPIEIKRDYHPKLWKAIDEQLIPFYAISPETEGRGLYLVLWFADQKLPTHPQGSKLPTTPEALEKMLKENIPPQYQKLMEVVVLDVSKNPKL